MKRPSHRGIIRAAAALLILWPLALHAQEADPKFWVTDGLLYTFARDGNTLCA